MRILLIDNYDSFTWNLYQLMAGISGEPPEVIRNDERAWPEIAARRFDRIVISPGPGSPDVPGDFGVCRDVIREAACPVLGVCLGHQGLGHAEGARVSHAPEPVHGRVSRVLHDRTGLFAGIPSPFSAVRYHSLAVTDIPDTLQCTAWTEDGIVMGLQHRHRPLYGVQFHPESICSEFGAELLTNFIAPRPRRRATGRSRIAIADREGRETGETRAAVPPSSPTADDSHDLHDSSASREIRGLRAAGDGGTASVTAAANGAGGAVGSGRILTRAIDWVDPAAAFAALFAGSESAFWLDSSRAEAGRARFSYMGDAGGPDAATLRYAVAQGTVTVRANGEEVAHGRDIFAQLRLELAALADLRVEAAPGGDRPIAASDATPASALPFPFQFGLVGYLGYEVRSEQPSKFVNTQPDAMFIRPARMIAVDHQERTLWLLHRARTAGDHAEAARWLDETQAALRAAPDVAQQAPRTPTTAPASAGVEMRLDLSPAEYLERIHRCLDAIRDGEAYELCLTNKLRLAGRVDPRTLYAALRRANPAPFAAYLQWPDIAVACSSPECFLSIAADRTVATKPIKGTARRAANPAEDQAIKEELRADEKARAENLMIVDLLRNDLGKVCEIGSVHVPSLMDIETYATVHQMVSTIVGTLRADRTAIDCIEATFPGGSMTGAPKLRAMSILEGLECAPRGVYSGAVGFLSADGRALFNIVIRTAVVTASEVTIGAGGAIVALSDPRAELLETLIKLEPVVAAYAEAVGVPVDAALDRLWSLSGDREAVVLV